MTDLLESVQRKFTKRIPSLNNMSYPERLTALNLEHLELRRLKFDMINYFKILSLNCYPELSNRFLVHIPPAAARSSYPRLVCPAKSKQQLSSSFFYRHVKAWNSLPDTLKIVKSILSFKSGLSKINLSNFLIGSCFK